MLHAISTCLVFKQFASTLITAARVQLLVELNNGDSAAAAIMLGNMRSVGALLEFLTGPLLGQLSDRYGRLPVMGAAAVASALGNLVVLLRPRSRRAHWLALVPVVALDTAYFTSMRAAMADVMSGRNIAQNAMMHMAPAGIAVMAAPLVAARLSSPQQCYRVATGVAAAAAVVIWNQREPNVAATRPAGRAGRTSLDLWAVQPLAFLRLFSSGGTLARLSLISGVQTYTDSRLLESVATLSMRGPLGWSAKRTSQHLAVMASSGFCGVPIGKYSIKRFGRIGHTHLSHAAKVAAYAVWAGAANGRRMRLAQLLLAFGQRQRDGVETMITEEGVARGMGKGLVESYKMNWRSVANLLAPLVYSRAFAWGQRVGRPGTPFWLAIAFTLLSELVLLEANLTDAPRLKGEGKEPHL